jgi:predicted DNA-binding transcriptional regulator AlpA
MGLFFYQYIMENLILQGISIESLKVIIEESVKNELAVFKKELQANESNEELLTRTEVCELLKIDSSTLWHWTNKGKVISYKICNRVYYKRSEIMNSFK